MFLGDQVLKPLFFIITFTFGSPCFHLSKRSVLKNVGPISLFQFFYLLTLRFYIRTKLAKKPGHIQLAQQLLFTASDFISPVLSLKMMGSSAQPNRFAIPHPLYTIPTNFSHSTAPTVTKRNDTSDIIITILKIFINYFYSLNYIYHHK